MAITERRKVLAGLGLGITAVAAAPVLTGEAGAESAAVHLLSTYVTGLAYATPAAAGDMHEGQRLELRRNPVCAYDSLTIDVLTGGGEPLGRIAPDDGRVLAVLMDAGVKTDARVTKVATGERPEIWFDVTITGPRIARSIG